MDELKHLILNIALAVLPLGYIPLYGLGRRRRPAAAGFFSLCALTALCFASRAAIFACVAGGGSPALTLTLARFYYAFQLFLPVALLLYALLGTNPWRGVRISSLAIVTALPAVSAALAFTTRYHSLLFALELSPEGLPHFGGFGTWHYIGIAYALCLYVYAMVLLLDKKLPRQGSFALTALACVLPAVSAASSVVLDALGIFSFNWGVRMYSCAACAALLFVSPLIGQDWEYKLLARANIFDSLSFPVIVLDGENRLADYNQAAAAWLNRLGGDLAGLPYQELQHRLMLEFKGITYGRGDFSGISLCGEDGVYTYYRREAHAFSHQGAAVGSYVVFTDITHAEKRIEQLDAMASHDQLTGLYNRRMCDSMLQDLDTAENYPLAIILGDVNNLKTINDQLGHEVGDQAICATADILCRYLPEDGFAARLGGDEFLMVLPCMDERGCDMFIKLVQQRCAFESGAQHIPLSISLGYCVKRDARMDLSQAKSEADKNMYKAKQQFKRATDPNASWYA